MEQIILSELVWDVSSPTPVDFIDILCHRLSEPAFFGIDVRTTLKIKSLAICIAQQTTIGKLRRKEVVFLVHFRVLDIYFHVFDGSQKRKQNF